MNDQQTDRPNYGQSLLQRYFGEPKKKKNKVIRPKSRASAFSEKSGKQIDDGRTDGWTDRRMDGWTIRQMDGPKINLQRCMNDMKTFKNIQDVFKLGETPFKQYCDGRTDGRTD